MSDHERTRCFPGSLPAFHKDPFDPLLIAQSMVEGIILLTADPVMARYPAPVQKV